MADLSLDALLNANLSGAAQSVLTPDMKSAMSKGLTIAADLTPAYNLIDTLSRGGTPDPMSSVAAMAGLATVVNPIAGAALMAAGALVTGIESGLQSLFQGLGLISDAPKPVQFVGLVRKGLPIPKDPNDSLWWPWAQFARVWYPQGSATAYTVMRPDSRLTGTEINITATPDALAAWQLLIAAANTDYVANISKLVPAQHNSIEKSVPYNLQPHNSFESFFFEVLKRDLEFWANGLPWLDPRTLLHAAVKAWNDKHPPSPGASYAYNADERSPQVIATLLSSRGDASGNAQRDTIDTIYGGQTVTSPPPTGPGAITQTIHTPATNVGPAQTLHMTISAPKVPPAVSDPLDALALKLAIGAGWTGSGPLPSVLSPTTIARIQALQARQGNAVSQAQTLLKVTAAKPLGKGMSTGVKVALASVLALGTAAIIMRAKD